jgi:chromosome segregation and condensation protein ScpB
MTEAQKIIQLCLYEGGPVKKSVLGIDEKKVGDIKNLIQPLGLQLIETKDSIEISLSLEINEHISKQKLEDLKTDLSESSLQTLSTILYRPGATKPEIDFIRGVDSVRSLKSLLTRGLIEKNFFKNKNSFQVSTDTLKFLGLNSVENLPDFPEISDKLEKLIKGE